MVNFESKGIIDESVWNEVSPAEIREKGRDARPMDKYMASKVLAERGELRMSALPNTHEVTS